MNDKIKVCHLTSAHKRYDQRILYRQCVSLQEAGYEVTMLVNDLLDDEEFKGVKIKSTKSDFIGKRFRRMIFGVKKIYDFAIKENADIYELHDPELLLIGLLLKKKGKKVIFDSHESYYDQIRIKRYLPCVFRNIMAKIYYRLESIVAQRIDAVIFPALLNGKNIFEGRARKTAIINNVPRLDEFSTNEMEENEKEKREGICYAGGLTYERGITILMKAAYKANTKLFLAGMFWPESYHQELKKQKESTVINYCGVLGREQVYQLYRHCKIGMATVFDVGQYGMFDNMLTKVYEYMAMGIPVILSDFPFNRKMIEKYHFGLLVNPKDVDDIAQKIRYLLDNPKEAEIFGENGRKLVFEKFNWSNEEKKLLKLYESI